MHTPTRLMDMSSDASSRPVVLEAAAQELVEATAGGPYVFDMTIAEGRKALDTMQDGEFPDPRGTTETLSIPGPLEEFSITIYRPTGKRGVLPVVLYAHGGGWAFGNLHTHDRLMRELTSRAEAATVFVSYSLSPEAKYPTAIEELYAALRWIAAHGSAHDLDPYRIAVAGDSAGGNMAAVLTLMAKRRGGPRISGQLLYYPRHRRRLRHPVLPRVC